MYNRHVAGGFKQIISTGIIHLARRFGALGRSYSLLDVSDGVGLRRHGQCVVQVAAHFNHVVGLYLPRRGHARHNQLRHVVVVTRL